MLDGGLSLLGVGGWELRDDLDVDLVVSLGILRAARREGGKDSRKARKRAEQRNSSDRLEQSSIRLEPRVRQISWTAQKLSSLGAKRIERQAEKDAKLSSLEANESENKLKKFYSPKNKLDSTSSLRLDKDPRWAREVGNVWLYSCRSSVCWRVIHAPCACAVLGCWRQGVAWQQSPARCLLPCIRALREKENFQLFHFVQPLKMVHF